MKEIDFRKQKHNYRIRLLILVFADVLGTFVSYFSALLARYDFRLAEVPHRYYPRLLVTIAVIIVITIGAYHFLHLYQSIWTYVSIEEAYRIVLAYVVMFPFLVASMFLAKSWLPRSVFVIGYILSFLFCAAIRFGYRLLRHIANNNRTRDSLSDKKRVLIVGGGQAAKEIIADIRNAHHSEYQVCAVVDDNPIKQNRYLEGVRIEGSRDDIPDLVEKYRINRIIFAIPSASVKDRRDIINICKETGCSIQMVPGLYQLLNGEVRVSRLRSVDIADLLGRDEIHTNIDEIKEAIAGKVILVTGGGGSIGSELCRQIADADAGRLIVFDVYENNAYDLQQELKHKYPDLDLVVLIGSVRNEGRIRSVIQEYRPDVVFHAAAHKHVPLMEDSPNEAIKNNVLGTYKTALAAADFGVRKFILISTDKAVHPTNIMGASKRLCEMVVQMMSRRYPGTVFSAVRFGNVLDSSGSVIPLFRKQIAEGGPVTVTDERVTRFFMTIPEAVSLVLQAGYYAKGGEVFVLDMGKPVRILDMAENMIKLSGFRPYKDIPIQITGLRPGEKLYEELLLSEEGLAKTDNDLIFVGRPIEMDDEAFMKDLERLEQLANDETKEMKQIVASIVKTYKPQM